MANLNFDARQVDPQTTYEALPAGWYNFMITESELMPTKAGDGAYLRLTLRVIDGQYAGRQVFDNLNLQNPNPVAVEISYRRLSAYCHATGVLQVQDSQQLHGIPFKARLSVRKDKDGQYDDQNEVKAVKNITDGEEQQGAPAWAPQQQAPQQPAWANQPPAPETTAALQQQGFPPQQAPAAGNPPWAQPAAPQQQPVPVQQPAALQQPASGNTPPWVQQTPPESPQTSAPGIPPWAKQ